MKKGCILFLFLFSFLLTGCSKRINSSYVEKEIERVEVFKLNQENGIPYLIDNDTIDYQKVEENKIFLGSILKEKEIVDLKQIISNGNLLKKFCFEEEYDLTDCLLSPLPNYILEMQIGNFKQVVLVWLKDRDPSFTSGYVVYQEEETLVRLELSNSDSKKLQEILTDLSV